MQPSPAPDAALSPGRLTIWSLLLRTAGVWARHIVVFTLVGLILDLPIAAVELRGPFPKDDIGAAWLYLLLMWFLRIIGTASLSLGVLRSLAGERPTVLEMLAHPARHLWPIFAAAGLYSGLVVLGLTLIVPGIFILVAGYLVIPAVVAEPDMGTEAALRRSFVLTEGHRLRLLAAFTILFGIEQLGSAAATWIMDGVLASSRPAGVAVLVVVDALLGGLTSCSFAVAYQDLRVAKGLSAPRIRSVARE
jgi:hypothetical protein